MEVPFRPSATVPPEPASNVFGRALMTSSEPEPPRDTLLYMKKISVGQISVQGVLKAYYLVTLRELLVLPFAASTQPRDGKESVVLAFTSSDTYL